MSFFDFFFNDTATTEIYTLSLHDALPIYTHSQTKTERIAKLYPLGHVTIVDIIVIFHHGLPAHGGQNLDGVIEFLEELVINLLLGIVRNLYSRAEFAIRYRAIHVCYATHAEYLYQRGHGPLGRRSLRYVIDRLPRLHDTFIGIVERSVIPWRV